MVQKYFFIIVMAIGVSVVSCRQDNELNTNEELNKDLLNKNSAVGEDNQNSAKSDSTVVGLTPNDPPKNGTHWKGADSLGISGDINDPPKNGTHWKLSDSTNVNIGGDTNDPPKNGTHWKTGK